MHLRHLRFTPRPLAARRRLAYTLPPMNIRFINQTFYPDVAATAQQLYDLAAYLTDRGHNVSVITSRSLYGKAGATLPKRETVHGIHIYRVGFSLFGKAGLLLRMLDFALFYLLATLRALTLPKADVVVTLTTPPFLGLAGWLISRLRRCRFVYWAMDLYPDVPIACGVLKPRGLAAKLFEWLNRFSLRHAHATVALGRCMQDRIIAKGIAPAHVALIPVWADTDEIKLQPPGQSPYRSEWKLEGKFVVMYSGNLGLGHDADTLFNAALTLKDHPTIRFVFAGGGKRAEALREFIQTHQLTNIIQQPYQPRERLGDLLTCADVHLVSLSEELTGLVVPSKFFGILAAARPVILVGTAQSEIARIITETNCGYIVPNGDVGGLADLVSSLTSPAREPELAAMGERGRQALDSHYDRRHGCEKWETLLAKVAQ